MSLPRTRRIACAILLSLAAFAASCGKAGERVSQSGRLGSAPTSNTNPAAQRVREPAVAGIFYPKEQEVLSRMIDQFLTTVEVDTISDLKALICPHAGYPYSGPTAAFAYRLLPGREFRTVIVLAPSHYAAFSGAWVCTADRYRTPLGMVEISEQAKELAKFKPFVADTRRRVERPSWWKLSSRPPPAEGEEAPDTWEHSDEVQIPFLQKTLKNFKVIPVILGEVDPEETARVLAQKIDGQTLLIASSDLSHYHPDAEAKALDAACVKAICNLDVEGMKTQEACGKLPILTLMHLAKAKGWKARALDYRHSGDTSGERGRVVGYTAIAFYDPAQDKFTAAERRTLLDLARKTVKEVVTNGRVPETQAGDYPKKFLEAKGCFVTLTKKGRLRGCIGNILPKGALYLAVVDNARLAATQDPRFPSVQREELAELEFEISILNEPQPLSFGSSAELLDKLKPHRDGVVLRIGDRGATYLPQVWAQIPDKTRFLNSLAEKAGCDASAWRNPGTTVSTYQVESFKETE